MAQWLRICLPMQGTRVRALVWEDPTCHGATKPAIHNYWARMTQLLKPTCLAPVLRHKRNHHNEKPRHRNKEWPLLAATRESCAQQQRPNADKNKLKKKKKDHCFSHFFSLCPYETQGGRDYYYLPILWMKKPRLREVNLPHS